MKLSCCVFLIAGLAGSASALKACTQIRSAAGCKARSHGWKASAACKWVYISGKSACVKKSYEILPGELTACKLIKDKAFCKSESGRCKYTKILGKSRCVNDKTYEGDVIGVPPDMTEPPTVSRVPCSEIDSYKKLSERSKYCLRRADCQYVNKRCLDLGVTKQPTVAVELNPTSSPTLKTGGVPCSEIDGYKLVNRQKYCLLRADCTLTSQNRCVDANDGDDVPEVTASPTAEATAAPTAEVTDAPTNPPTCKSGGVSCATLDGYAVAANKKKYCEVRCDCTYFEAENRCLDLGATLPPAATDAPTGSPTQTPFSDAQCGAFDGDKVGCQGKADRGCVWNAKKITGLPSVKLCTDGRDDHAALPPAVTDAPTAAPTSGGVSTPNCAQYNFDFKDDCLATEGCEWNLVKPQKKCTNARTTKEFCNNYHGMESECVAYGCTYKTNTNCGCAGVSC